MGWQEEGYEDEYELREERDLRVIRERAAQADAAEARVADLRRQVAFLKVGIDVESAAGRALLRGYEGSLDDLAKVAQEYGIPLRPPGSPVE
jgi:hypothetical protein